MHHDLKAQTLAAQHERLLARQREEHEAKQTHQLRRSQVHIDLKAQLLAKQHEEALARLAAEHEAKHAHHRQTSRVMSDLKARRMEAEFHNQVRLMEACFVAAAYEEPAHGLGP